MSGLTGKPEPDSVGTVRRDFPFDVEHALLHILENLSDQVSPEWILVQCVRWGRPAISIRIGWNAFSLSQVQRSMNDCLVGSLAHLRALPDLLEQCDGEFSADMLLFGFIETPEDFQAAIRSLEVERAMPGRGRSETIEQTE